MPWRKILANNREWVAERNAADPEFFTRMASKHEPHYLWIGCSDARVPANVITGTDAGEMFVHRNIANQVMATDPNLGAVVQYAVEALKVKDIIVCGHAECGGVRAALEGNAPPQVDSWLANLRMIARLHQEELEAIPEKAAKVARLVELNVVEQVHNIARLPVVQDAWANDVELRVHGFVYDLHDGVLRDMGVSMYSPRSAEARRAEPAPRVPMSQPATAERRAS